MRYHYRVPYKPSYGYIKEITIMDTIMSSGVVEVTPTPVAITKL